MAQQLMEQFFPPIQSDGLNTNTTVTFGGALSVASTANFLQRSVPVDSTNGTSPTLTSLQSGSVVLLDSATGSNVRLPAPVKGIFFDFVISTAATTGSHGIVTDAGTTFLLGSALSTGTGPAATGASTVATFFADGAATTAMRMGQSSNASAGTFVHVAAISSTKWVVSGNMVSGTAPSTVSPFKTG